MKKSLLAALALSTSLLTGCVIQAPAPAAPRVTAPVAAPTPNVVQGSYICPLGIVYTLTLTDKTAHVALNGDDMGPIRISSNDAGTSLILSYDSHTKAGKTYNVILVLQTQDSADILYASTWDMAKRNAKKPDYEMGCKLVTVK